MKEIILNNKNYLLVEAGLPLVTNDVPIGYVSDILKDEEVCKGLVESFILYVGSQRLHEQGAVDKLVYNNYVDEQVPKSKATDSFQSWTESIDLDLTKSWALILKV